MKNLLGAVVLFGFASVSWAGNAADDRVATVEIKDCIVANGVVTGNCTNVKRIAKKRNASPVKVSCEIVNGVNTNVCHPVEEVAEASK